MPSKKAAENGTDKDGTLPAGLAALTISDKNANHEGVKVEVEEDDDDLFKPPPPNEECALCFLPLPNEAGEIGYAPCCGKMICIGCVWKHRQVLAAINAKRALKDPPKPPLEDNCSFCRASNVVETNEEMIKKFEARMALNDPKAFEMMASYYQKGLYGLPRDSRKEFELRLRGAELGSAKACFDVSCMYRDGDGVERNTLKQEHYLKLAAKKGHILARHNLGVIEFEKGNFDIAVRHWMISASAGDDKSLKGLEIAYRKKHATKDQFEKAIRAKHAAKKEMQSEERDKARAARSKGWQGGPNKISSGGA